MPVPTNRVYKAPGQGEIAVRLPRGKMRWPTRTPGRPDWKPPAHPRKPDGKNPRFEGSPEELRMRIRLEGC